MKIRKEISMASQGFTLIELMIVVAVLAIVSAIALPMYRGYLQTSAEGVLVNNISTIEIFQEDFRLRTGNYLLVAANEAAITAAIGWNPQKNDGTTYSIANPGNGNYRVTATSPDGTVVCMELPIGTRC